MPREKTSGPLLSAEQRGRNEFRYRPERRGSHNERAKIALYLWFDEMKNPDIAKLRQAHRPKQEEKS
jgi:hypothetical protein